PELFHRYAADIADGDLRVLTLALGLLDHLAATLLGELRDADPQNVTVVGRVHTQIRVADRGLDGAELGRFIGLDHHHARFGHGDTGHLGDRRGRSVVVDDD